MNTPSTAAPGTTQTLRAAIAGQVFAFAGYGLGLPRAEYLGEESCGGVLGEQMSGVVLP